MSRGSQLVLQALVSVCLGLSVALLLASVCLVANRDRINLGTEMWFNDGRVPWLVARHEGFGTWWVNATRVYAPLLGNVPEDFTPPQWARELWGPSANLPPTARMGALAGGWPLPAIAQSWITLETSEIFPPTAEFDLTGAVMDMARDRMGEAGILKLRLIPLGIFIDSLPWFVVALWLLRMRTARAVRVNRFTRATVTPPAATEAPHEPKA